MCSSMHFPDCCWKSVARKVHIIQTNTVIESSTLAKQSSKLMVLEHANVSKNTTAIIINECHSVSSDLSGQGQGTSEGVRCYLALGHG